MKIDPRHQARILALLKFYSEFFGDEGIIPEETIKELPGTAQVDLELLKHLVAGVKAHQPKLDELIKASAPEWPLDRIAKIDLAILRISVYELESGSVNTSVAIDEAVELAKEFGGESSAKFVNGVLGSVAERLNNDKSLN